MRQRRPPSLRKRHGRGRHEPAQANSHGKQTPARLYPIDERTWGRRHVSLKRCEALPATSAGAFVPILRKEVIQPQVPLRLPCYDFTPVAEPTVVGCLQ